MNRRALASSVACSSGLLLLLAACGSTPISSGAGSDGGSVAADGGLGVVDGGTTGSDGGTAGSDGGTAGSDGGTAGAPLGGPCTGNADCASGICATEAASGFPGGYCTAACPATDCPSGGACVTDVGFCGAVCTQGVPGGCRAGYTCTPTSTGTTVCVPGTAGANIGDACANGGACPVGGACITEASSGFPGGYCSRGCTVGGNECGSAAICADPDGPNGALQAICLRLCNGDDNCRTPGYVCEQGWFGQTLPAKACVPGTRTDTSVGAACTNLGACAPSSLCLGVNAGFPGGYCAQPCSAASPTCAGDAFCATTFGLCLDGCNNANDCRAGYGCTRRLSGVPLTHSACVAFHDGSHVGDPCTTFANCSLGGACIPEIDADGGATGFTGGYCTAACGLTNTACPGGSTCAMLGQVNACVDDCAASTDCRQSEGYVCAPVGLVPHDACLPASLVDGGL